MISAPLKLSPNGPRSSIWPHCSDLLVHLSGMTVIRCGLYLCVIYSHTAMPPTNLSEEYAAYLKVALEAAEAAGKVIKAAWSQEKQVEHKGAVDLVTETDQQCEKLIHSMLSQAFPSHR